MKMKIKVLKKAVTTIKNNRNLVARVMFDMQDQELWVDVFASTNDRCVYPDNIQCIYTRDPLWGDDAPKMQELKNRIEHCVAHGTMERYHTF